MRSGVQAPSPCRSSLTTLPKRIASRRHTEALEGKEGLRRKPAPLLSAHVKSYLEWTAKAHRTQEKSERVLKEFAEFIGEKRLDQVTTFDIERWKTARAAEVARSTVNRELNVVRGALSRAVQCVTAHVKPRKSGPTKI